MKILLTSAGRRGYLVRYFKEANSEAEIHVANSTPYATAMYFADATVVTPLIHEKSYIPFLLDYCQEHTINVIIPLFDVDLPVLSKHIKQFEQIGVHVIVSSEEVIAICNDKWETYQFLESNGLRTPVTFLSLEEALVAIKEQEIGYPVMVKPRWGMGSILVLEAENEEELVLFYKKVRRNIERTYLSFESHQHYDECVIIQEKLIGQEYGLDIINNLKGNYQTTIVKKKRSMRAGETDCAETVHHTELSQIGERLGHCVKHIGNLDVDIFLNETGAYVLEMNARFGGGYPFSHLAGTNLPKAIMSWLQGREINRNVLEAKPGIVGYKDISII